MFVINLLGLLIPPQLFFIYFASEHWNFEIKPINQQFVKLIEDIHIYTYGYTPCWCYGEIEGIFFKYVLEWSILTQYFSWVKSNWPNLHLNTCKLN